MTDPVTSPTTGRLSSTKAVYIGRSIWTLQVHGRLHSALELTLEIALNIFHRTTPLLYAATVSYRITGCSILKIHNLPARCFFGDQTFLRIRRKIYWFDFDCCVQIWKGFGFLKTTFQGQITLAWPPNMKYGKTPSNPEKKVVRPEERGRPDPRPGE